MKLADFPKSLLPPC